MSVADDLSWQRPWRPMAAHRQTERWQVLASDDRVGRRPREPAGPAQIGRLLRALYDPVLAEPVPGRFLELMRRIELERPAE